MHDFSAEGVDYATFHVRGRYNEIYSFLSSGHNHLCISENLPIQNNIDPDLYYASPV